LSNWSVEREKSENWEAEEARCRRDSSSAIFSVCRAFSYNHFFLYRFLCYSENEHCSERWGLGSDPLTFSVEFENWYWYIIEMKDVFIYFLSALCFRHPVLFPFYSFFSPLNNKLRLQTTLRRVTELCQ